MTIMEDSQTAAAALEEEKTLTAAAAEEEGGTQAEEGPSPERKVIDGKKMVRRKLPTETVQRMLSRSARPIPTGSVINPMVLESRKKLTVIREFVQQRQEAMREELRTMGYVMGWVTDDDEE